MDEILKRVWENLVNRLSGPLNFRFIVQPAVAGFLAIRAALKDAQEERPAFLWAAITNPLYRHHLFRQFWNDSWKVFALAIVLDAIYQLIVHRGVYVLELFLVAAILALVPYVLLRGPVTRITKLFHRRSKK
jgi:drug/metabolite transporter (DMT)-like permease